MKNIFIVLFCVLFIQCSIDRTIVQITSTENNILRTFQKLNSGSKLFITDDQEPGEKLYLCLTFITKHDKKLLPKQRVGFYHTSNEGEYEPSDTDNESTSRLSGVATTDESGRIYVETILPGAYGSSEDNRHIHTNVYGAKPEAYDINFSQYTNIMGRSFSNGSDQHFLTDLKRAQDGKLVCFLTIEVKAPKKDK